MPYLKSVEDFISKNYTSTNREDAKTDALAKLLDSVQTQVEVKVVSLAEELEATVESFINQVSDYRNSKNESVKVGALSIPFDARAAFVGGATGITLLVVTKVSVATILSSIGFGSTAALAFLTAIGGPVSLIVGLSSLASLSVWALVRQSWQKRLANKIVKILSDEGLLQKMLNASNKYWDGTKQAFEQRLKCIVDNFDDYVLNLTRLLQASDRSEIERILKDLESLKIFFTGIPWKSPDPLQKLV
jgi:hypothetical protein